MATTIGHRVIHGRDPWIYNNGATANTQSSALKLSTICHLSLRDPRVKHEDDNFLVDSYLKQ
jgi:hypothetical protein